MNQRRYTYRSWHGAIYRCYNPKFKDYHNYGGRGITVCDRWRESFDNFIADMGFRPPGTTLDRIDNSGNYERDNCRWITQAEQLLNTRRSLPFPGITKRCQRWRVKKHRRHIGTFDTLEEAKKAYLAA